MRISYNAYTSLANSHTSKSTRHKHRTLNMNMGVNKSWKNIRKFCLTRTNILYLANMLILNMHYSLEYFSGIYIYNVSVNLFHN